VRDYAQSHQVSEVDGLRKGVQEKAVEFVKQGSRVYKKA
jgi:phosphomethylpyrimidine synthase